MGTFNTKKKLFGAASLIPVMASRIQGEFQNEGYEVKSDALNSGAYDISVTKGGVFKAVLGMRTALHVTLVPQGNDVAFEASVGIFGQQAIPTVISMFFFWPVLITQIWGLVTQAKLDDKALEITEKVIQNSSINSPVSTECFCTNCGNPVVPHAKFCPKCGAQNKDEANWLLG